MRIFAHFFVTILSLACLTANVYAAEAIKPGKIRLGLDSLPLSFGLPYRSAALPSIYTTSAIYDGLTRIGLDGALKPWLATSWESIDGLTWRFKLRDGVTFSNGAPLTAEAFKVAVDYLASPDAARESLTREIPRLKSARVIDAYTIEITLAEPDAMFPRSAAVLFVGEPGAWQRLGREGFSKEPVGTGPYKVVEWQANRLIMTAFEKSWRAPRMRDLEIIAIPDGAPRTQGLLAKQIDIAMGLAPEALETIEAEGGQGLRTPAGQVQGWSFMLQREGQRTEGPLQDKRVRQAMTMAVNRQLIVDAILGGAGRVASQPATENTYGYNPDIKPLPYDPAAAKKLLAEAGYPKGFNISLLSTAGAVGALAEVHQRIAADLAKVGINVEIRTTPVPQYLAYLGRGNFPTDAFGLTWPNDPNLDAIRPLRIHSCLRREPFYCDQSIMPKIEKAITALDENERFKLRREIMAWYHDEAPALYIYEDTRFTGLSANVKGFAEAYGLIAYDQIEITK